MKDKEFIKKILQEQEIKLSNFDFTNQVMYRIYLQQERKKYFYQLIGFFVAIGLIAWMYIAIKPYFKEFGSLILQIWKLQSIQNFFSLSYLIVYLIFLIIGFFFYEMEGRIFKKL